MRRPAKGHSAERGRQREREGEGEGAQTSLPLRMEGMQSGLTVTDMALAYKGADQHGPCAKLPTESRLTFAPALIHLWISE